MLKIGLANLPRSPFTEEELDKLEGTFAEKKPQPQEYLEKAKEFFLKAVDLKDSNAMNYLGFICQDENNFKEATEWFRKALDLGNVVSLYNIALHCQNRNYREEAIYWYKISSDYNDYRSTYNLAIMYMNHGEYDEALPLLKKLDKQQQDKTVLEHKYVELEYYKVADMLKDCIDNTKTLETVHSDINKDTCACCSKPLKSTHNCVLTLLCGHSFHYKCIHQIANCPMCEDKIMIED